ncbi:hypothetical protein ACFYTQ_28095 [Nocardia sp. NPDC004068]|uniref:hypothetical protein n=1 Tax=Nocardia sp. NPDC004068 TaxID=3364303 RepID=UPI0036A13F7F
MTETINASTRARFAAVAVALHEAFDASPHAPDSVEVWLAIAEEAARRLATDTVAPQWFPVFAIYRKVRTEARVYPDTGQVEITSGDLEGNTYPDLAGAARAVVLNYHRWAGVGAIGGPPAWRLDSLGHLPVRRALAGTPGH